LIDPRPASLWIPRNKGKGYEIGRAEFIQVNDAKLETIQIESTHAIKINKFVPGAQIEKPYKDRWELP
jgi:non-homologous end joining protein Ku